MGAELNRQALALGLALALGVLTGVCYDFFRPIRRSVGRTAAALLDALFCVVAGVGIFIYAMCADNGRLGVWELTAALVGFLAYMYTLSKPILAFFTTTFGILRRAYKVCKKFLIKSALSAKKFFQKVRKCIIIKTRDRQSAEK